MKTKDLADSIRKLKHLDRQCIELSYEHAKPTDATGLREYLIELFTLCYAAFTLWNDIRQYMSEASSIKIHDKDIRHELKRIKDNQELYVIRQYKSLVSLFNKCGETDLTYLWTTTCSVNLMSCLRNFMFSLITLYFIEEKRRRGA